MSFHSISRTRQRSKLYSQRHFYFRAEINFFWDGGLGLGLWKKHKTTLKVFLGRSTTRLLWSFSFWLKIRARLSWGRQNSTKLKEAHSQTCKCVKRRKHKFIAWTTTQKHFYGPNIWTSVRQNSITFLKFLQMTLWNGSTFSFQSNAWHPRSLNSFHNDL